MFLPLINHDSIQAILTRLNAILTAKERTYTTALLTAQAKGRTVGSINV